MMMPNMMNGMNIRMPQNMMMNQPGQNYPNHGSLLRPPPSTQGV